MDNLVNFGAKYFRQESLRIISLNQSTGISWDGLNVVEVYLNVLRYHSIGMIHNNCMEFFVDYGLQMQILFLNNFIEVNFFALHINLLYCIF